MKRILRASADNKTPIKANLVSQKTQGLTTITLDSLDGWRKNERVPFIIVEKDLATGKYKQGTQTSWTGVVSDSANTITSLELTGGVDQTYPTGSAVIATPTSQWANDLVDALLVNLNTDGTLKDRVIKNRNIDDGAIEGVKIKDNTLTVDKVDWTTQYVFEDNSGAANSLTYKTITIPNLVAGGRYMVVHTSATAGNNGGVGTISAKMTVDDIEIASASSVVTQSGWQNPRFNLTGVFTARGTTAQFKASFTANGVGANVSGYGQRTAVVRIG